MANKRRDVYKAKPMTGGKKVIGRSSALAALKKLTEEGLIIKEGSGRSTFYVRADSK